MLPLVRTSRKPIRVERQPVAVSRTPCYIRQGRKTLPERKLKAKEVFFLLCLTFGALLVHGYHPWAEDAEIYLPGVEKILHPHLFPHNADFFEVYARMSLFHRYLAWSVELSHLRLPVVLFLWQVASIFLFLLACWHLSGRCFADPKARWAGVAMAAALLTLPVAGTALYVIDQYVNPRNFAAFAAVFAIVDVLEEKYSWATLWLVFAASVHPLMAAFALSFAALLMVMKKLKLDFAWLGSFLPISFSFQQPSRAYHEAALFKSFHYIQLWQWYEWLGIVGPIPILWWFARMARSRGSRDLNLLCHALIIYDLVYLIAALIVDLPARFESLARIQPLRSLHLLYVLLIVFAGGFIGERILKNHVWRWLALFVPLCIGMYIAQRQLFPASAHVEWPWAGQRNPWARAFLWARENTPADAFFALDPLYNRIPGEDMQGFRALAQRSRMADGIKDSGAVTMFPPLAEEWYRQMQAQTGWKNYTASDFQRLRRDYGVSWVIVQQPGVSGLSCPYRNSAVLVCQLN